MKPYLIALLFSLLLCSCNDESNIKNILTDQANFLDLEFKELGFSIFYNQSISKEYASLQEKLIKMEDLIAKIEGLLVKNNRLTNETLTEIENFYLVCNETDLIISSIDSTIFDSNKHQLVYWNEIYSQKHKISSLDKTILINHLKLTRNILLSRQFNDLESGNFRFREIIPLVFEDTPNVNKGGVYKAKIAVAIVRPAKFKLSNEFIEMDKGKWEIEIPCTQKGDFEWSGEIYLNHDNREFKVPLSRSYTVK